MGMACYVIHPFIRSRDARQTMPALLVLGLRLDAAQSNLCCFRIITSELGSSRHNYYYSYSNVCILCSVAWAMPAEPKLIAIRHLVSYAEHVIYCTKELISGFYSLTIFAAKHKTTLVIWHHHHQQRYTIFYCLSLLLLVLLRSLLLVLYSMSFCSSRRMA